MAGAIYTGIKTGDAGLAFEALATGLALTVVSYTVSAGLAMGLEALGGEALRQAYQAASTGYSGYGVGQSARGGDVIGAVVGGLSLAFVAYGALQGSSGSPRQKVVSGQEGGNRGGLLSSIATFVIGENYGEAWRDMFAGRWSRGSSPRGLPTGWSLPKSLAEAMEALAGLLPGNAMDNGMHAWHAGSNALAARKLGILGAPLIVLAGIVHETPLDWRSFKAEQKFQGTVNHFLDSVTDIGANLFGLAVGYVAGGSAVGLATRWGNYIPGPGETDPAFGGDGAYEGSPSQAWGRY